MAAEEQRADAPPARGSTFISRAQVAGMFGVSVSTVTRWAREGLVPAIRTPGGHYRFRADDMRHASGAVTLPEESR